MTARGHFAQSSRCIAKIHASSYDFEVDYLYDRLNDAWRGRAPRQVQ